MADVTETHQSKQIRVADFSGLNLSLPYTVSCNTNHVQTLVGEIRNHTDLPFVFVFNADQKDLVSEVLDTLKGTHSPCYPYALCMLNGNQKEQDAMGANYPDVDTLTSGTADAAAVEKTLRDYAAEKLTFDPSALTFPHPGPLPETVDVMIVGAGMTGLYAAKILKEKNLSVCVVEKRGEIGGIWSLYANSTSQVNSSEPAYRLIFDKTRSNRDHSFTREVLGDLATLACEVSGSLFLNTQAGHIDKTDTGYQTRISQGDKQVTVRSTGVILAINDRVGEPRLIQWPNQEAFQGDILSGISNNTAAYDWAGKHVVVIGMGAFAVENVRTALEGGASHVTVVCRRHGTICPKIIDYLNFSTPYNETFEHDKKSNLRNMLLWKKLYDQSGATQPECWMGKIKHTGHTISVSDIWFVGHYLKKISTVTGSVTDMDATGVIVNNENHIQADCVVNCVGFHRNAGIVKNICDYRRMTNVNFVDKDFMYLADAYIDDDVFNSFFGSSVLEMARFYMQVYLRFFNTPDYESMIRLEGIDTIDIETRSWSHYIAGAMALLKAYPELYAAAKAQVDTRTRQFLENYDLPSYIAANKREWMDMHTLLSGKSMSEDQCLPYVFEKLIK